MAGETIDETGNKLDSLAAADLLNGLVVDLAEDNGQHSE